MKTGNPFDLPVRVENSYYQVEILYESLETIWKLARAGDKCQNVGLGTAGGHTTQI